MSAGTCTVHTWNDGADDDESGIPTGRSVDHELKEDRRLQNTSADASGRGASLRSRLRSRFVGRAADEDDEGIGNVW